MTDPLECHIYLDEWLICMVNLWVDKQTSNGSVMGALLRWQDISSQYHPRTCKWLISMVNKSPKHWVVPLPNGLINDGLLITYFILG